MCSECAPITLCVIVNCVSKTKLLCLIQDQSQSSLHYFCIVWVVQEVPHVKQKINIQFTNPHCAKFIIYFCFFNRQSEETFCWALLMSHLVVLPACSLLGAQMELLPRIFFSAWSVFWYHMVITMLLHVCTFISRRFGTCDNCVQFAGKMFSFFPLYTSKFTYGSCLKLQKVKSF